MSDKMMLAAVDSIWIQRVFAEVTRSLCAGALLSQLWRSARKTDGVRRGLYKFDRAKMDGFRLEAGLSTNEYDQAKSSLISLSLITHREYGEVFFYPPHLMKLIERFYAEEETAL